MNHNEIIEVQIQKELEPFTTSQKIFNGFMDVAVFCFVIFCITLNICKLIDIFRTKKFDDPK